MRGFLPAFFKERGARQTHKRLLYCVNVNCTSLDHLLLGGSADVDKMSSKPSIARDRGDVRTGVSLTSLVPKNVHGDKTVRAGCNLAGLPFVDVRLTLQALWRGHLLLVIYREQEIVTEGDSFVMPFSFSLAN